jgi:hypothetical protein
MRQLRKGEAQIGMVAFYKTTGGDFVPVEIGFIQDRGTYDFLEVRKKTKSGKTLKGFGTMGQDDLWLP